MTALIKYLPVIISFIMGATSIVANTSSALGVLGQLKASYGGHFIIVAFVSLAIGLFTASLTKVLKPPLSIYTMVIQYAMYSIATGFFIVASYMYFTYQEPEPEPVEEVKEKTFAEKIKATSEAISHSVKEAKVVAKKVEEEVKKLSPEQKKVLYGLVVAVFGGMIYMLYSSGSSMGGGIKEGIKSASQGIIASCIAAVIGFLLLGPVGMVLGGTLGMGITALLKSIPWRYIIMFLAAIVLVVALWWLLGPIAAAAGSFWSTAVTIPFTSTVITYAVASKIAIGTALVSGITFLSSVVYSLWSPLSNLLSRRTTPLTN